MESNAIKARFANELSKTLPHLYDPGKLRHSPLLHLFSIEGRADSPTAFQRIVTGAIEALKPDDSVPSTSNAWRVYQILYYRYTEQFTQREVSADLALSVRQLRRQEKIALQVLADYLWSHHKLDRGAHLLASPTQDDDSTPSASEETPSRDEELEWLARAVPSEAVDVQATLLAVLETIRPLLHSLRVTAKVEIPDKLRPVTVKLTSMRQALLHILTIAARHAPEGEIHITAGATAGRGVTHIVVASHPTSHRSVDKNNDENLEFARSLIQMSGGSLKVALDDARSIPFTAEVTLPTAEQIVVLIVDDNADTLQLLRRYLSESRYRCVDTPDPLEAMALAEQIEPDIVVLDVMLAGIDGWELLGRLREHPKTREAPIIVCTILPQEQLALTLGAAEFLHKPVSRHTLLSALDRQIGRIWKEPR